MFVCACFVLFLSYSVVTLLAIILVRFNELQTREIEREREREIDRDREREIDRDRERERD